MKTKINFYYQNAVVTATPSFKISNEEVKDSTVSKTLQYYCDARISYSIFWDETRQSKNRKRQRYLKRKALFSSFSDETQKRFREIQEKIKLKKINQLKKCVIEITHLKSKKQNMARFIQAIELDLNVGGISPQYWELGLRDYNIIP